MTMLRVRLATRGRNTTSPCGSVIFWWTKSRPLDKVSDEPLIDATVTVDSRRALGARRAGSGIRSSSPTCQPIGEAVRLTLVAPAETEPAVSTKAVLLQPTRV